MTAVGAQIAFLCPFCGKARQWVRVGLEDKSGRLVVEHPEPDDCDTWQHYSATPRTRAMFVRMATREVVDLVGGRA